MSGGIDREGSDHTNQVNAVIQIDSQYAMSGDIRKFLITLMKKLLLFKRITSTL